MVKSSQPLLMCDRLQLTSPEQVLNAVCHYLQKNAGFVLGAGGGRFRVGSVECSCYSSSSLPALLLSV